jgi:hypothetical protein
MGDRGNPYDEYVDDADYYVLDVKTNNLQKLPLKKKMLKKGFANDADKADKFIAGNSDDIDDTYLAKFGSYMNQ